MCLADIAILPPRASTRELPKTITPEQRELARMAAAINADWRRDCTPEQKDLRNVFELNERLFSEIAG